MATVAIVGLLVSTASDRLLASTLETDMPWFAQFGLCGLFGALLWWKIARTDPETAKAQAAAVETAAKIHAEALGEVKDELVGMRSDQNSQQAATQRLLEQALFNDRGPK